MRRKLLSVAVLAWLVFAPGAPLCAALMVGAQPSDAHDCCEKPKEHSHDQQDECALLCAIARDALGATDNVVVEKQQSLLSAAPAPLPVLSSLPSADRQPVDFRPPDTGPPLYVLHAVFRI